MLSGVHTIARLTINRNHSNMDKSCDRVLACILHASTYGFRTYSPADANLDISIEHKIHDGVWNLLSYTYKKNIAKAIVLYHDKE